MKKTTRLLFLVLRVAIAAALLIYLGTSGAINWAALHGLIAEWPLTLTAFIVLVAAAVITAWRLCVLMKARGFHLSLISSVRLTLIGTFFNACLPGSTSGDVVKIYYTTEGKRGRRTEVATIMLLDRAVGMFALLIWPLLAAPFFQQLVGSSAILRGLLWAAAAVAAIMLAGMLISSSSSMRNAPLMAWAFRKLPFGLYGEKVFNTLHVYRHNRGALMKAVMLSLLAHTMTIGVILLTAQATNANGFAWQMSILVPRGFLANTIPLTPGGLGVGETAFNRLFAIAGLTGGAEAILGWRLLTILCGLIGLVFYIQGRKYFIQESLSPQGMTEELSYL